MQKIKLGISAITYLQEQNDYYLHIRTDFKIKIDYSVLSII